MRTGFLLFFAIVAILIFQSPTSQAANKVVVVRETGHKMYEPLARELNASGFNAHIIDAPDDMDLEQVARRENASAAIRLNLKGKQVEVWVADRITGKIVARTVRLEPGGEPEDSIVVLAAVELLRASLMEIYAVKKPPGEVAVDESTKQFAEPAALPPQTSKKRISLHLVLGGGGAFMGSDTGFSGHGHTSLTLELYEQFQFSVVGQFPFSPHELSLPEGSVNIYPFYWGAETIALFRETSRRFRPILGMGMGAAVFYSKASKSRSFEESQSITLQTKEQSVIVPIPYMKGGFRFQATELLFLRMDYILGISTEKTRVAVNGRTVAYIGRPWMSVNLAVEITLW
ncbi:MAG: hypothetical protein JXX29_03180 [Deltaproteobacteria bacterium]|nr:hypothetical protein [Deltaproteobacteria bacterium]MBN2670644.1 hypothetical protein [Deltaproteobacteria bacterium]